MERLQKQISALGYCSRRKAEELIVKGLVKVNGTVVTELGTKVEPTDIIEVEGNTLSKQEKEYYGIELQEKVYELIENSFLEEKVKRMYKQSYIERLHRFQRSDK